MLLENASTRASSTFENVTFCSFANFSESTLKSNRPKQGAGLQPESQMCPWAEAQLVQNIQRPNHAFLFPLLVSHPDILFENKEEIYS